MPAYTILYRNRRYANRERRFYLNALNQRDALSKSEALLITSGNNPKHWRLPKIWEVRNVRH